MGWITENRRAAAVETRAEPYLTEEIRHELTTRYLPRFPRKQAALLPALHMIQHAYNWIPPKAIEEIALFLEISPAEAMDTATFYEEYWLKPKGEFLVQVCRSLSCEICGSRKLTDHLINKLNVEPGETTQDGRFTLVELECLGACGTAPVMLINDVLHENLTVEQVDQLVNKLPQKAADYKDPQVTWEDAHH
jgi:NADH-quinone oxidoreductase E subunit